MNDMEGITAKVNLPPVTQIGVVVRDLDQAMDYYSKTFGLGPFNPVFELAPDKSWYMGRESPLHLRIGRTRWGAMDLELVQPLKGKSIHQDFLDTHGEGLHHLGIDVDNYEEVIQRMSEAGFKPLQALEVFLSMNNSWAKATYFDTQKTGGIILEVLYRPWMAKH
jgi:4-hydroxyphenylpyruvate dioxygenase-like putative hemolysin